MSARPVVERVGVADVLEIRRSVLFPGEHSSAARMKRDFDLTSRHWAIREHGRVVAAVSVMPYRGQVLRGMAVVPERQGRGLGALLLERVHADIDAPLWCNARLPAVGFYVRCGWTPEGPVFDQDGSPHQRLVWAPR